MTTAKDNFSDCGLKVSYKLIFNDWV